MHILALETSTRTASVAALHDTDLVVEKVMDADRSTAQDLAPLTAQVLHDAGWKAAQVQLVAVSHGPGSFTGLRVGVTAAKAMAYALGAEVLGVDTLEVVAQQAPAEAVLVEAVIDAQRRQLFAALYRRRDDGDLESVRPAQLIDRQRWLDNLPHGAWVTGPGLKTLVDRIPPLVHAAPSQLWTPRAATVGRLARRYYQAGHRHDLWRLAPRYMRPSAAEEKLADRDQSRSDSRER